RAGAQAPAHLEAVDVRQVDVEDDEGGVFLLGGGERVGARARLDDLEAAGAQDADRGVERRRVVVDDEDLLARRLGRRRRIHGIASTSAAAYCIGSFTQKREPLPTSLST